MEYHGISNEPVRGIDKLEILVNYIPVLTGGSETTKKEFTTFKSWLAEKIKRKITLHEEVALVQGIIEYINTDGETNERLAAMKYLYDLEFLTNP